MRRNARGFTLIEIMVAMLLSGVVIGAVYSIHQSQLHVYTVQNDAVAMQQNERVGMDSLA
ncbi:MAG: prepilin-type N-terminal cleavage/methylation domain-containing protein, partial [Deltaproteobacteria bacterium]|nr:prepilin-type N-terminal cleavage/methylation domain-containing protein [Deltaproteobacteria bacterium]